MVFLLRHFGVCQQVSFSGDWVTIGVIFYKSSQTSKNGNTYTIWKMSDLQGSGDFQTASVLLFGKAHTKHYPMPLNKVVGILNPKVLEDRSGKGDVSLSVDNPEKVLELGDSVDVGKCQGKRQDGTGCTALVNKHQVHYKHTDFHYMIDSIENFPSLSFRSSIAPTM